MNGKTTLRIEDMPDKALEVFLSYHCQLAAIASHEAVRRGLIPASPPEPTSKERRRRYWRKR